MLKDEVEKTFWMTIISSVLFSTYGIYLLFKPNAAITLLSRGLTIITGAVAIFGLVKYLTRKDKTKKIDLNLIYSIIAFVIAFVVFFYPQIISGLIPIAMGIFMISNLLCKLGYLKELNRAKNKDFGTGVLIFIIMLFLGIVQIFNPLKEVLSMNQSIGMFITFYAVLDVINCYLFRNNIN